jgi:hypothetical protein
MKLVLINPSMNTCFVRHKSVNVPPLNLALIAALTPGDNEISIIDEQMDKVDYDELDAFLESINQT